MIIDTDKIPPRIGATVLRLLCELRAAELENESRSLSRLAEKFGLSTAAMTGAQNAAAKEGWVTSRHSTLDRRQKILELTHEGLALVESMRVRAGAEGGEGVAA